MRSVAVGISALFLAFTAGAQDSTGVKSWSLSGYVKDMQTVIFGNINKPWAFDNLIHNRLNFKWQISPSFTTAIEMRNRLAFGNMTLQYTDYYSSFSNDNGVIDLSWNLAEGPSYVLNATIDRAWLDFSKGHFEMTLGRQRVNWGINYVWNPNDIFNTYSYLDFDYEEKPGCGALRVQYYPASIGRVELTVKAASDWVMTAAALYQFNRWNYDFQVLGGVMNGQDLVAGAGWSGQIAKGGFRGELSYFHHAAKFADTTGIFVGSVGYDYTFRNSLMVQGEALYNGNPNGNLLTLFSFNPNTPYALNAANPFLSEFSVFAGATYPFFPLLTGSLAGIWNWDNAVYILVPSLTLSVTDNIDLLLTAQIFNIYGHNYPVTDIKFVFLRFKWNF